MSRPLICPECGMIELPVGTDRCPDCGLTALDDNDPANRDAIDEAIQLRRDLMRPKWMIPVGIVGFFVGLVGGSLALDSPAGGQLFGYVALLATMLVVSNIARRRLTPAWQAAIEKHANARGDREIARAKRWSTTSFAALMCVAFVGINAAVGIDALAFSRNDELVRPWRIATAAFTHAGVVNLLGNLLALFAFGIAIDLRLGRKATAAILAVAAVAGSLAQAQYSPQSMVGFSGAIFGLIGATLAVMPTRPTLLFLQGVAIPMPTWLWALLMIPVFTLTAWVDQRSHVAWVAHLGGFAAGFVIGLPMRRIPTTRLFERYEEGRQQRLERLASR